MQFKNTGKVHVIGHGGAEAGSSGL